jgi:crotonobetainyl-CoA:carnitine CoA-transferase CaiB-like acyl-CoA transferase
MSDSTTTTGPLSGTLVIDLSRALAGPHATMMFGDLGARIIKVEAPGVGDDTRGWGPPFVQAPDRTTAPPRSRRTSCRPTATRSRSPST